MQVQNFDERKIVSTAPATGTRAILCRPQNSEDLTSPLEFAAVDIAFWAIDESGEMTPHVFDSELGKPVSLEWVLFNYGGLCAASGILESKVSVISKDDRDRFAGTVRRKQQKYIA